MTPNSFHYLVYDIESVADKGLLNKVEFPAEGLSDDAALARYISELPEDKGGFVNPSFHCPISLAAVAVGSDFGITKIGLFGGDTQVERTTASIVRDFWKTYNTKRPVLVDFFGKGFDIRVLELWAFRLGITIDRRHFDKFGTRYRFGEEHHFDLHEFLTNYGAVRFRGGLDLFSKILGKPGKMTTKGHMVQELYDQGKFFEIDDYCLADAIDTYFVFLRTRVMMGTLTLDQEARLVDATHLTLQTMSAKQGYFKQYLEAFGKWDPVQSLK